MQVIRAYQNQQRRPVFQPGMQQSPASPLQAPSQQTQPQQPRQFMAPTDPNAVAGTSITCADSLLEYIAYSYN